MKSFYYFFHIFILSARWVIQYCVFTSKNSQIYNLSIANDFLLNFYPKSPFNNFQDGVILIDFY